MMRPCIDRVRVEQQLVGIEAVPFPGRVRSMDAVSVELARPQARNIAVPDFVRELGKRQPCRFAAPVSVVEANFDARGVGGEDRKVDAVRIRRRAQRVGQATFDAETGSAHRLWASASSKTTVARGGSVSSSEYGRPCARRSTAMTAPAFPTLEPP